MSLRSLGLGLAIGVGVGFLIGWAASKTSIASGESSGGVPSVVEPGPNLMTGQLTRTSGSGKSSSATTLDDLRALHSPVMRLAALTQWGYDLAGQDPDDALHRLDALADGDEKLAFLRGLFTRVAEERAPYEAIQRVKRLDRRLELEGYQALVSHWTGQSMAKVRDFRTFYEVLLGSSGVANDVKEAWLKAHRGHHAEGRMLAAMAGSMIAEDPEEALALGEGLEGWQREGFVRAVASQWMARGDREAAWEWFREQAEGVEEGRLSELIGQWYGRDKEGATMALGTISDPDEQLRASALLGELKAQREGTRAAVAWADALADEAARDAAHAAIYDATPRGIGAILNDDQGLLNVGHVMPGTPAEQAGLRTGDRLLEIDSGAGTFESLDGAALGDAVERIRGEPGSALRLRVLRVDGTVAVLDLNRQQLILDGESK